MENTLKLDSDKFSDKNQLCVRSQYASEHHTSYDTRACGKSLSPKYLWYFQWVRYFTYLQSRESIQHRTHDVWDCNLSEHIGSKQNKCARTHVWSTILTHENHLFYIRIFSSRHILKFWLAMSKLLNWKEKNVMLPAWIRVNLRRIHASSQAKYSWMRATQYVPYQIY